MTDLEWQLQEWAKWSRQGCELAAAYPSAWPLEGVWKPYKSCDTACDQHDDFEAARPADERIGTRMETWVSQLDAPQRVSVRVRYVYLPDDAFHVYETKGASYRSNRRAWDCFHRLREAGHKINGINGDQFDAWLGEAMADLRWMHQKWAEGV